jgi:signal transduction histidine kinase
MNRRRFLRDVRTRLLAIVLATLVLGFAAAVVGFAFLLTRTTDTDANKVLRARAAAELAIVRVHDGAIRLEPTTSGSISDSSVWVFDGTTPVQAAHADAKTQGVVNALIGSKARFVTVQGNDVRLFAQPIVHDGSRVGTLVTAISLEPYEHTRGKAVQAVVIFFVVVLLLVGLAVWWLLRSALRPVAQMTEQAAAWSEQDLDRRFALGEPHDELTRLASTLDALLDRLAASLRHERYFSAELSHELRTPLAKLMAEAELALRRQRSAPEYRESLEVVLRNAQQIERIVETLINAARQAAQPQGVANALDVAQGAVAACAPTGIAVDVLDGNPNLRVGVDRDLAEGILRPVVENACRYGRSAVRVSISRDGSVVLFAVEDDGPGVRPEEEESIFEPAVRGSAGLGGPGAGLGLSLARRLARAAAGDVVAQPGAHGHFVVRLPAA